MKRFLLVCLTAVFTLASSAVWAQDRTVSGKVTAAEDGSTLPGVNVTVKGTTKGTVSDANGSYSLDVPTGSATLVFSFIGLKTIEVAVGERSVIDVTMETDATQLSEVIVTGYSVQEKRTLTGSVAVLKGETFQNVPVQSMDRALQGRAAGVQVSAASGQPGGALNVRIRGIGSINASNDPLWIVDGVQLGRLGGSTQSSSNPLGSINPNDIESIDVLKDAASAAIYGAQAANGVIIVTTKKGKKGTSNFDVSAQYGVVKPLNLYDVLNAKDYATLRREAFLNAGQPYTGPNPDDPALQSTDWKNAMFRDAALGTYDFSLSSGDEKTQFLLSGSYQFQEGQLIQSDWKRGTTRLNISHRMTDRFTVGMNMSLAYQRSFGAIENGNFVNGPFTATFIAQPTSPIYDDAGKYALYPIQAPNSHLFGYNIVQGVNEEIRTGKTFQTVSSLNGSFKIVDGLSLNGLIGVDFSNNRDDNNRPQTIPAFATSNGQVTITNRRTINWNSNVTLNYSKKFNDIHSVSGIIGYEYKQQVRQGVTAAQFGYADPYFRLLSSGSTARPATEFFSEFRRQGYFGQLKYAFKEKYIADVTVRRDGSSRFGAKNRYGTFYAGSLAWRIKEESFLQSVSFLDDLKLRVAYGVVGNSEINDYDGLTSFGGRVQAQYLGGAVLAPTRIGNDLITWEEENQFNVGLDFAFLRNRLYGSIEYYDNLTTGMLLDVPLPTDSGFGSVKGNTGEVSNSGIDFELGAIVVDKAGFRWNATFNLGTLKNELTSLANGQTRIGNDYIVGEPLYFHYLFNFAGVNPANGKTMIYDTLGNLAYAGTPRDAAVRASAVPTYYGGLDNTFSYKGITLSVFFQYQGGNSAYLGDLYNLYTSGSNADNQLTSQMNRWQNPGDITNVHKPFSGNTIEGHDQYFGSFGTTQFMSDASYIRLKQVTLSYELPSSLVQKVRMKKAKIFVQGLNLMTWTKFYGIDPEVISNNDNNNLSTYGSYPVGRQYAAGISLGF